MILQVKQIQKTFNSSNFTLKDISFDVSENEVVGIVGENGVGKSTLLKMINYLVPYDKGEIIYQNEILHQCSVEKLRNIRKEIVYIFQNANLLENKSVEYHLSLVYKLNNEKVDKNKIEEVLQFTNLKHLKKQSCGKLSGGQKQKVAIAMAILQNPKILLCDEISAGLDVNSEKEIFQLLNDIKKKSNIALIIISHHLMILKNMCDKILFIQNQTIDEIIIPNKNDKLNSVNGYAQYIKEFFYA